jgi:RnfABCDGE-type electron transport complex G subunit
MNVNSRFGVLLVLVIMAVICSTALAIVNIKIAPIIEKNNLIKDMSTILGIFGIPYDVKNSDGIIAAYHQSIEEREVQGLKLFTDKGSGRTAISLTGPGFQGPFTVLVALEGEIISGFKVLNQVETPGLGARITEPSFQKSFIGKKFSGGITMVKTGNAGPSEFDAITGATETSKALQKILNRGFTQYFKTVQK